MKGTKLKAIEKACKLSDNIFSLAVKKIRAKELLTEKQVSNFIDSQIRKAGAKKSFPTIVASGKNAVSWHHKPKKVKLHRGFCVIDFGSKVSGYCSDMTRTIFIGKASKSEKRLYKLVLKTQKKCISKVKAGAKGNELYNLAKKSLGAYAHFFTHGLGHGLGRKIHSKPGLGKKKVSLKAGDIITIEPGIYIPNSMGIRIEDDLLVTKRGYRVISRSSKKLFEINL
ncbi:MAG: M24 family metallopeptidase [Candidatus Diapherotrites archaeon]|nr:M24 family metallopeptidase [Candidatus Diapherotrites archaeon]